MQPINQETITVTKEDIKEQRARIIKFFILSNLLTMIATLTFTSLTHNLSVLVNSMDEKKEYMESHATQQKQQ